MYNTIIPRKIAIYRTHLQVLENMHTHTLHSSSGSTLQGLRREELERVLA